jgi:predicted nuclease of predicted toxin-antitoxin system
MKILLDERIPRKFKDSLAGHICSTAPEAGFAGRKNGELLSLAEQNGYEVFLTLDKGLQYQQNLAQRSIAIIIVRARSNRIADLVPHAKTCLEQIASIRSGQIVLVGDM